MDNTDKYPPQAPSQGVPSDTAGNDSGDASRGKGVAPGQGVPSDTGTSHSNLPRQSGQAPSQGVPTNTQPKK